MAKKTKRILMTWRQLMEVCKHSSGIATCYHRLQRDKNSPVCWHHKDCPIWSRHKKVVSDKEN